MKPADYRLVRSKISTGISIGIKRQVLSKKEDDQTFSYWLYGERKMKKQFPILIHRSIPCLICSSNQEKNKEFSLLTVNESLFQHCLFIFNHQQLSILYSLLENDYQSYQDQIQQEYLQYQNILIQILKQKLMMKIFL